MVLHVPRYKQTFVLKRRLVSEQTHMTNNLYNKELKLVYPMSAVSFFCAMNIWLIVGKRLCERTYFKGNKKKTSQQSDSEDFSI